jgi:hypothetical protein
LWISYDLDRALFFDNDSGERVDLARDLRSIGRMEE